MIYAIYKCYKGSGIADVLVAARYRVIAEGPVDHALRKALLTCPALPFSIV